MKLLSSDSYNVAWFKLADFVARGEKERALIVYKLLMHSVRDKAFSCQLEGDILLAFDDDAALDKYHQAANMYKKDKKLKKAVAVYEHAAFFKEDLKIIEALLDVHALLQDQEGIIATFSRFASLALKEHDVGLLINKLHSFLIYKNDHLMLHLYSSTVLAFATYKADNSHYSTYLQQALDLCIMLDDAKWLDSFMAQIKALNEKYYQEAKQYLAEG